MKILHVLRTMDPSAGGPPRVAARLAAGQAALGHDVAIASYGVGEDQKYFEEMTCRLPSIRHVKLVVLPKERLLPTVAGKRLCTRVRAEVDNADVVHLHNLWEAPVRIAGLHACKTGKPYVLQPNDILNPWSLAQKRVKKMLGLALCYRRVIEGASRVIFGHEQEKLQVLQNGFHIHPEVLPLGGVFPDEVHPLPSVGAFYQRHPELHNRPFSVFLSRLHYKKGLDFLAEGFAYAAKRHPDLCLVVIGQDEGAQRDFVERVVSHGVESRVFLLGPMHGQDKWEAYVDASCFVLPSRNEAYTIAITEAIAAGLPVVVSKTCHFPDATEYSAGIECDLNAQSIGSGILELVSSKHVRDNASRNAMRLFHDRLNFSRNRWYVTGHL